MKKQSLIEIYKKGDEYGLKIPAGTEGRDIEIGLATSIIQIEQPQ